MCACALSRVWLFVTPWTVALEAPQSMEFSSKNTVEGCHFLLQGILLTQGSNPHLLCPLHCQAGSLPLCHLESQIYLLGYLITQLMDISVATNFVVLVNILYYLYILRAITFECHSIVTLRYICMSRNAKYKGTHVLNTSAFHCVVF